MKMYDITAKDHEARKGMNSPLSVMAFLRNMWKVMWTQGVLFYEKQKRSQNTRLNWEDKFSWLIPPPPPPCFLF